MNLKENDWTISFCSMLYIPPMCFTVMFNILQDFATVLYICRCLHNWIPPYELVYRILCFILRYIVRNILLNITLWSWANAFGICCKLDPCICASLLFIRIVQWLNKSWNYWLETYFVVIDRSIWNNSSQYINWNGMSWSVKTYLSIYNTYHQKYNWTNFPGRTCNATPIKETVLLFGMRLIHVI